MEYTRNEIRLSSGFVINMTHVEIRPYTERLVAPDKAILVGIDEGEVLATPSTSFSILKSYELRFDEIVTNNPDITDRDKNTIKLETCLILSLRSSVTLNNLELTSEYADVNADYLFTYPVFLQYNKMSYLNLHIRTSGMVLRTSDPLNIYIENIDVDYYRNSGGFDLNIVCNYPEANLNASMEVYNSTFYNSQTKIINPVKGGVIRCDLPGNLILRDYY